MLYLLDRKTSAFWMLSDFIWVNSEFFKTDTKFILYGPFVKVNMIY